jgi:hypothetical protein
MALSTINSRSIAAGALRDSDLGTLDTLTVSGNATFDTSTLVVDAANNRVGVGTGSPSYKLDVFNSTTDTGSQLRVKNTYASANADAVVNIDGWGSSTLKLWRNGVEEWKLERIVSTDDLGLYAYGGPVSGGAGVGLVQFWDYDTGNVGIGTASPNNTLEIKSTTNADGIRLSNAVGSYYHLVRSNGDGLLFDADAGNTGGAGADIRFLVKNTEHMRISADGRVGIQETSPDAYLHVKGKASYTTANTSEVSGLQFVRFQPASTSEDSLWFHNSGNVLGISAYSDAATTSPDHLTLQTYGGNVGIGDNNPTQKLSVNGNIKVDAGSTGYVQGPTGEMLIGEDTGGFYIGTGFGINPAIPFYYGNPGATASHNFRGTAFNVTTNNAYFTLTSSTSNVIFNNGVQLIYGSDGGSQLSLWADNSGPTHLAGYTFDIKTGPNNSRTFRGFRQDQSGVVTIGHNAGGPNNGYTTAMDLRYVGAGTEYGIDFLPYLDGANALTFWNAAGSVSGAINVGASSTLYNTSSDYRLKTEVTYDWDATSRLKQLKPARFKWIVDGDDAAFVDGFLAHECEAVPEAVTGTKDAMRDERYEVTPAVLDEDGNEVTPAVMGTRSVPEHQSIDQSKIVPLLTKALIEAIEKIEQLEARIITLEAN